MSDRHGPPATSSQDVKIQKEVTMKRRPSYISVLAKCRTGRSSFPILMANSVSPQRETRLFRIDHTVFSKSFILLGCTLIMSRYKH